MEKDEIKRVSKESRYAAWTIFKWIVVVGVILITAGLLVFWTLTASGIVTLNTQRKVIQHSQQYVETKVNLLNKLYNDWLQLDSEIKEMHATGGDPGVIAAKEAQQAETLRRMKTEASMIPNMAPTEIRQFISEH